MIVVADTSPLSYLVRLDLSAILERLYRQVLIPPAVLAELTDPDTPDVVRSWAKQLPVWITVTSPKSAISSELNKLDRGEAEAVQLALELQPDLILIDERAGTDIARSLGLRTTGTVGVILTAAELGLLDASSTLERLLSTNFRISAELKAKLLPKKL